MSRTINISCEDGEVLIMQDKVNSAVIKDCTIKVWLNNSTPQVFNYKNKEIAKENFAKLKKYLNEEEGTNIKEKLIDKACAGDNCYWLKQQSRDLRYIVSGITRIAKVAKEDVENEL